MRLISSSSSFAQDPAWDCLDEKSQYKVVINHEEVNSIWPVDREIPAGWEEAGKEGTKQEEFMKNLKKVTVLFMVLYLISSGTFLALGQEPVELIPWKKLAEFFIDISGWAKKGDPEGSQMEMGSITKSQATQPFVSENGERRLEVHITDSAKSMVILMPFQMLMMQNMKTDQEFVEKITIKDFPGVKTYNYSTKEAGLILLILERFIFEMHGYNFSEDEVSELEEAAKEHDLDGIAQLGK